MLQANVGAIRAETWETIHKELLEDARRRKLDSQLLGDGVPVLTRIMQRAYDEDGRGGDRRARARCGWRHWLCRSARSLRAARRDSVPAEEIDG